jgi:soluble lytic murein transglycosylase-like protein
MTGKQIIEQETEIIFEGEKFEKFKKNTKKATTAALIAATLAGSYHYGKLANKLTDKPAVIKDVSPIESGPEEPPAHMRPPPKEEKVEEKETEIAKIHRLVNQYRGTIPYNFMDALIKTESEYKPRAVSYSGARFGRGLCQISEILLEEYNKRNKTDISPTDLFDIETNIKISCWYVKDLMRQFNNDPYKVYAAYNIGAPRFRQYMDTYLEGKSPFGGAYTGLRRFKSYYDPITTVAKAKNNVEDDG